MRIGREQMFMEIARAAAKRSTCHRLNVGALIVNGKNVASLAYNGSVSGAQHCFGTGCQRSKDHGGCSISVHAEDNALQRLPDNLTVDPEGLTLYVTHSPCSRCVEKIVASKIKTVVYESEYRDAAPLQVLIAAGIAVHRLTPSGYVMNIVTQEVRETK